MAKEYRRGRATRAINWWYERLTKLGVGASYRQHPHGARAENGTASLDPGGRDRAEWAPLVGRRLRACELGPERSRERRGQTQPRQPDRGIQDDGSRSPGP